MTAHVVSMQDINEILKRRGVDAVMDAMIARLHDALLSLDWQTVDIPTRAGFEYNRPRPGLVEWMPMLRREDRVTIKTVGYHPNNPEQTGLPSVLSTVQQFDVATGQLCAVVDGTLITALRTGAASAIATRAMVSPSTSKLGLIGCGAQAVAQVHAIARVLPIDTIRYTDVNDDARASFEQRCAELAPRARFVAAEIAEVVCESEVLCTATSIAPGAGPLFQNLQYPRRGHINAIGSDFPGKTELPLDLLEASFVCPDFLPQALLEGECQQLTAEQVGCDLVQLLQAGDQKEMLTDQQTVFDSTGFALEDEVAAELILELAREEALGHHIDSANAALDPRDPYSAIRQRPTTTKAQYS